MKLRLKTYLMTACSKRMLPFYMIPLLAACAKMGSPDGGWFDDDPPRVVSCTPADQATGVNAKKITILFDEYIKLDNATSKVIVSPPQLEQPEIKAAGKRIVVELQDSLKANTTYTIDFSDAISDNNEGNPMGNYTYTFSTGERIDTFEVAGNVLEAKNLEPVKGILVGLYDDLSDSAFQTKPLMRVARTDGRGRFVIKGVAPGQYRVYALQDVDGNYLFNQKSEMIAFSHQTFTPSAGPDTRQDTIWRDSLHIDNIIRVPYTHFYPDDVVLMAFEETPTDRYLIKTDRTDADRIKMIFSIGHEQLPHIRGLNFNSDNAFVLESSLKKDTLTYWLRDTTLINQDTLRMERTYLISDSTGALVSLTDTIEAVPKYSYEKRLKQRKREWEDWYKQQQKQKRHGEKYDSIMPLPPLRPKYNAAQQMEPDGVITIEIPTPLEKLDTTAIHLYSQIDSLWYNAPFNFHPKDSMLRHFEIEAEWRPGTEYSLEIDSAAFIDIYGKASNTFKTGIRVRELDEFCTLSFRLSGVADTTIVVQLLNQSDNVLKETTADNMTADFNYITPGTYYLRAFIDSNKNGIWDTGDYANDKAPEEVYYYPHAIECKAKWDVQLPWNITATQRTLQKPSEITKQKPDKEQQKLRNRNAERARRLGIEYVKDKQYSK